MSCDPRYFSLADRPSDDLETWQSMATHITQISQHSQRIHSVHVCALLKQSKKHALNPHTGVSFRLESLKIPGAVASKSHWPLQNLIGPFIKREKHVMYENLDSIAGLRQFKTNLPFVTIYRRSESTGPVRSVTPTHIVHTYPSTC